MTEVKTKLQHYAIRIEWHDTRWVDVAVSAASVQEACALAYQEANYDAQDTYDDSGDSFISKIAELPTRKKADDVEQRGQLWDLPGVPIPAKEQDPQTRAAATVAAARAMLQALEALNEWGEQMGQWDAPCWSAALNAIAAARAADIGE